MAEQLASPLLQGRIINVAVTKPHANSPAGRCPVCGDAAARLYCSIRCYRAVQRSGDIRARFWAKVNTHGPIPSHMAALGPCWLWTAGRLGPDGYGGFATGVKSKGGYPMPVYAHRVAWELERGPIPAGKHVLHHCDTPACVRAAHLFLGDQDANMKDASAKGRLNKRPRLAVAS
jgi:hypothetical protein